MTRSEMREQAFVLLFEKEFVKEIATEDLENIYSENVAELSEFGKSLFEGCTEHLYEIDKTISKYLRSWKLERISKTSLAVLRLAFYEIKYCPDIAKEITANEAVNITKKYADPKEASFVNGIIGGYIRDLDE